MNVWDPGYNGELLTIQYPTETVQITYHCFKYGLVNQCLKQMGIEERKTTVHKLALWIENRISYLSEAYHCNREDIEAHVIVVGYPGCFRYTGLRNTALAKAQSVQEAIEFQNAHSLQIEAIDNNE